MSAAYSIQLHGSALRFEQASDDTLLRAGLRAGIGLPYECNAGGCGSCKVEVLSGECRVLWPDAPGLTPRDRLKGRQLACQCVATTDMVIKVRTAAEFLPAVTPRRRQAHLLGWTEVTHDIRAFRFATADPADFVPGQFASLLLPGVAAPRSYSMANLPNAHGVWEFMVRRVPGGRATQVLFDGLAPGTAIGLDGPYGLAGLRPDAPRDLVCVAGGSGLAPMLSVARGAVAAGLLPQRRLHFFYGARTPHDLPGEAWLHELRRWAPALQFYPVVSDRPSASAAGWPGEQGWVHEALPRLLGDGLAGHEFYLAGPPPMIQAVQEMLMLTLRVPYPHIHFDRFF